MPVASLSVFRNCLSQSVCGVPPVRLHGSLRRGGQARTDGANDYGVFANGQRQFIQEKADIQASVALNLRLDRAMECDHARACDVVDVGAMELLVQLITPVDTRALAKLDGEVMVDGPQTTHERLAGRPGELCRLSRGESLKVTDEQKEVATVLLRQRCDRESLVGAGTERFDKTLLLQTVQGAAHRRAAEVESRRDGPFDDATTGR